MGGANSSYFISLSMYTSLCGILLKMAQLNRFHDRSATCKCTRSTIMETMPTKASVVILALTMPLKPLAAHKRYLLHKTLVLRHDNPVQMEKRTICCPHHLQICVLRVLCVLASPISQCSSVFHDAGTKLVRTLLSRSNHIAGGASSSAD